MKRSAMFGWIVLLTLGSVLAFQSVAIAACGNPSGNPSGPPGLLVSANATGTKLYGVVAIEFYPHGGVLDAKVWMRLRKGSTLNLFSGQIRGISSLSPAEIQSALVDAADPATGITISQQISDAYFQGLKTNIAVKNIDNYMETDFLSLIDQPTCTSLGMSTCLPFIVLADVELAAY